MPDCMGSGCSACAGNGASASQQSLLTLKGLWDGLPLSLFLQVCGTSAAKDVISKLNPDDDRPMGDSPALQLSLPEALFQLCGGLPPIVCLQQSLGLPQPGRSPQSSLEL